MNWMSNMSHQSGRACVRCHKELTDAASMEVGIGPVCRKLDNALLAAQIPADISAARLALSNVPIEKLEPQTMVTFAEVDGALNDPSALLRSDWRKEVKRLEWLLSFEASRKAALVALTGVVRSLGYVGLASLWEGTASTGVAKVRFADGRLYVAGPRNSDFRYAIKQLPGWKFHATSGSDRPEWSLPAASYSGFNTLVMTYYPVSDGRQEAVKAAEDMVNAILATASNPVVAQPVVTIAPIGAPVASAAKGKVRVETGAEWMKVFTPYNSQFISDLKLGIAYGARRWEPVGRCWEVRVTEQGVVKNLLDKYFGAGSIIEAAAAPAPAPLVVTAPAGVMPF